MVSKRRRSTLHIAGEKRKKGLFNLVHVFFLVLVLVLFLVLLALFLVLLVLFLVLLALFPVLLVHVLAPF